MSTYDRVIIGDAYRRIFQMINVHLLFECVLPQEFHGLPVRHITLLHR